MKKEHKIALGVLHQRLNLQAGYEFSQYQWRTLIYAWCAQRRRMNRHAKACDIFKKGWLSEKDAVSLSVYAGYSLL